MSGCHQPAEKFSGNVLPFAWFARGLRLLDISDPFRPREVGCYEPDPPAGCERASSNDVTTDDRGLLYLLDRQRGLDIIESSVYGPDHDLSATSLWQQESQPAVPSGGAGGRLRLRIGPGGQGRERRHAGRHHRTAHARHHRSDAAGAAGGRLRPGRRGQGHRLPGGRARFRPLQRRVQGVFPGRMLARTTVEARAVIDTKIEIECIAYKPQRS